MMSTIFSDHSRPFYIPQELLDMAKKQTTPRLHKCSDITCRVDLPNPKTRYWKPHISQPGYELVFCKRCYERDNFQIHPSSIAREIDLLTTPTDVDIKTLGV